MTKIALFAGSFDPFTKGHLATLEKALTIFDHVIVGVMTNNSKDYLLTVDQRVAIIKDVTRDQPNVEVVAKPTMLTTTLAEQVGADFLIRGLRNGEDLTYEAGIAAINQQLASQITTIFLLADPQLAFVSSSMIKEVLSFGGDVSTYLTPLAIELLTKRLRK